MMDEKSRRREAAKAFKERETVGGLYRIVNTVSGWKSEILATPNLPGKINSFQFGVKTNGCFDPSIREQWAQYGPTAFALEEIERLTKKPEQDTRAFREELDELLALWREKDTAATAPGVTPE